MTVAAYIAKELQKHGVKYVFGIPGSASIPYMEELRKAGIEFILTSNEASAGIMADVSGRLSGIPGICHATYGPGATNLSTGIGGAFLDRSPVLAFTSVITEKLRQRTIQMNIDQQSIFENLSKTSVILDENNVAGAISDSIELARAEYPGPVHLGLQSDLADKNVNETIVNYLPEEWGQEVVIDAETASLLEYSRKPILAIGLTASRLKMDCEILEFLNNCPMPVILTPMAKGIVPDNHDWYCGVLFHALSDRLVTVIEEADLIIGFGYDPVEYNYESWMPDIPLIHINTIKTDMPDGMMVKELTGSLEGLLLMISSAIGGNSEWDNNTVRKCRNEILKPLENAGKKFGPLEALISMRKILPSETILSLDVGSHLHVFGQYWNTPAPGKLLMTNGWSSMGFAIPAAIAAKMLNPEIPVVCVSGDGGFLMMCGELITARRLNLDIIIIVLADRELNLIKIKEQHKKLSSYGVDLYDGDLFGSDVFLGVPVLKCETQQSLERAIENALSTSGPIILELVIDSSDYKDLICV